MRTLRVAAVSGLSVVLALGSVIACGDSSSDSPPANFFPTADGGADGTATNDGPDGSSTIDGSSPDGGDGSIDYEVGPTVCKANLQVGATSTLAVSTASDDRFGSITSDELTIAWATESAGTVTVHYAERAAATDPFGTAQTLTGAFAFDRVALGGNGLALFVVNADGKGVTRFERGDRTEAFVPAAANGEFDNVAAALGASEKLGDLVFAFGGQLLYYSVHGGTSLDTVRIATRLGSGSPWDVGGTLAFPELKAQGAMRKRPTGVGSDNKSLFFWDEVSSTEKMGLLKGSLGFFSVHDLGARKFASPSDDCSKLYFTGGTDLQTAPTN